MKEAQVFDHTAVVWGSGMGNGSSHSNRNLPVILAGGGMNHQGHVVCPAEDHNACAAVEPVAVDAAVVRRRGGSVW